MGIIPPRIAAALTLAALAIAAAAAADPPAPGSAKAGDRTVRLADGTDRPLRAPKGGALVLVFGSVECPLSNAYSPRLNALIKSFPAGKLAIVGAFVDPEATEASVTAHAKEFALEFPVAVDRGGRLARAMGVKVTPEVVVFDEAGAVRYSGRIDDRYVGRGKANAHPSSADLQDAVAAILAGRPVARPRVEAVGCPLPEP